MTRPPHDVTGHRICNATTVRLELVFWPHLLPGTYDACSFDRRGADEVIDTYSLRACTTMK